MDRWEGKVAIVTGASAGIGAAICEALVKHGVIVVGLARRADKIKEAAAKLKGSKGTLHAVACDLCKDEDVTKAFEWVEKELGGADILINNAGVVAMEPIVGGSVETYRRIINTNVIALATCCSLGIQSMQRRKVLGHVINVNSVIGHYAEAIALPVSLYGASKYAVKAISAGLKHEMAASKSPIRITNLSPGAVKTEILGNREIPKELDAAWPRLEAKDIADSVIYVLGAPQSVEINELMITPSGGSMCVPNIKMN